MKIEKPFSLAIAAAATGCALGLLPTLQAGISALHDLSKVSVSDVYWDMGYAAIFALSVGVAIVTWINATSGESEAKALLEEIKKRPMLPMAR